jgi:hypothetical protein
MRARPKGLASGVVEFAVAVAEFPTSASLYDDAVR